MKLLTNVPLKPLHTFHLNYKCQYYTSIKNVDDLREVIKFNTKKKLILGNGSNTIFTQDFDGLVMHNEIPEIEVISEDDEHIILKCGGGVLWNDLIDFCVCNELYGLENLVGIPGSVGAAPVQNVGAYGVEIADTLQKVDFLKFDDLQIISLTHDQCHLSYRDSIFKHELKNKGCIIYVYFSLSKIPHFNLSYGSLKEHFTNTNITLKTLVATIKKIRDAKIPDTNIHGNAGSFFQNAIIKKEQTKILLNKFPNLPIWNINDKYDKISSAYLMDKCGLKNFTKYGLKINDKNPLILINENCQQGVNLHKFVNEIKAIVYNLTKVELSVEPNIF